MVLAQDGAIETLVVVGRAITETLAAVEAHPDVVAFEIVTQCSTRATAQIKTREPEVLSAASHAGTPLFYPIKVTQGNVTVTVVGKHSNISALGEQLRKDGLCFEVLYIQDEPEVREVLTDRQEEIFLTAVEQGYYKSPRECSLTDVSDVLGIAKSTCSATLQRAEGAVVEYFCLQQAPSRQITVESQRLLVDGH